LRKRRPASLNEFFIVVWTDREPAQDGLAEAARAQGGQLLAAGPVQDVSELDSRSAPAGLVVARFGTAENATAWLAATGDTFDGTALLVAGATEPVWWPPEMETQRPGWSHRADFPPDRLGQFVSVWVEITDPEQFFDYSAHYRWTVEYGGGVVLVPGAQPSQVVLRGGPGPQAMSLMAWPADPHTRRAWYEGSHYRPYRDQRHRSSRTTNISVRALSLGD
jgi:uncharacterized protein (DUF1330 family)